MDALAVGIAGLGATVAVAGWAWAALFALRLVLHHRAEGRSILDYAVGGHLFYSASNFAPSGAPVIRQFLRGVGAFVVGWLLVAAGFLVGHAAGVPG